MIDHQQSRTGIATGHKEGGTQTCIGYATIPLAQISRSNHLPVFLILPAKINFMCTNWSPAHFSLFYLEQSLPLIETQEYRAVEVTSCHQIWSSAITQSPILSTLTKIIKAHSMVSSVCVPISVGVLLQEFKVYMACNFLYDLTYDQFRAICSPVSIFLQSKQLPSHTHLPPVLSCLIWGCALEEEVRQYMLRYYDHIPALL